MSEENTPTDPPAPLETADEAYINSAILFLQDRLANGCDQCKKLLAAGLKTWLPIP